MMSAANTPAEGTLAIRQQVKYIFGHADGCAHEAGDYDAACHDVQASHMSFHLDSNTKPCAS